MTFSIRAFLLISSSSESISASISFRYQFTTEAFFSSSSSSAAEHKPLENVQLGKQKSARRGRLTVLRVAQMEDQQVGDALVLGEGQAEGRFGLGAGLSVTIYTVHMTINTISVTVDSVDSVWDVHAYNRKVSGQLSACTVCMETNMHTYVSGERPTVLLLLLLQLVVLLQVDVRRLHSDDGLVEETEGFLHVFGLHLETGRGNMSVCTTHASGRPCLSLMTNNCAHVRVMKCHQTFHELPGCAPTSSQLVLLAKFKMAVTANMKRATTHPVKLQ